MDLEAEIMQNTRDITRVALTVERVATMVEVSEKRNDANMKTVDEIFSQIKQLNEKVSSTVSMKDDVSGLRDDLRSARHDIGNIQNSLHAIAVLNEKVIELKADTNEKLIKLDAQLLVERGRINLIENRNTSIDGGIKVARWGMYIMWVVFGSAITSMGWWFFSSYFQQSATLTQSYQSKQVISGE